MYKNASNKNIGIIQKKKVSQLNYTKKQENSPKKSRVKNFSFTRKPGGNTQYGTVHFGCGTKLTKLVQALTESRVLLSARCVQCIRRRQGRGGVTKQCSVGAFTKFTELRFQQLLYSYDSITYTLTQLQGGVYSIYGIQYRIVYIYRFVSVSLSCVSKRRH